MHVDLLNDQSAELRDAETFTRGERTALYRAAREADATDDKDNPVGLASRALFAGVVVSWTLPFQLPSVDPSVVDEILAMDFNVLDRAVADVMKKLSPASNFAEDLDAASPTKPSNG